MKPAIRFFSLMFLLSSYNAAGQEDFVFYSELAQEWYEGGDYFEWTSTTRNNNSAIIDVFYRTWGNPNNPQLIIIHGFQNYSFDYLDLIPFL